MNLNRGICTNTDFGAHISRKTNAYGIDVDVRKLVFLIKILEHAQKIIGKAIYFCLVLKYKNLDIKCE